MTGKEGTPRNDGEGARSPHRHSEQPRYHPTPNCHSDPPIVIPNSPHCHSEPPTCHSERSEESKVSFNGLPIPTTSHRPSTVDSSACAPQNDRGEGALQNDNKGAPPSPSFRTPPPVIPNGVRNLRSPLMACPFLRRAIGHTSILDSSACAPQNDMEGRCASE